MEKALFLSFIVPVYNVEKYLEECLDSLLEQDLPHEEYEIICVNDGSTDASPEILRGYAEKYPNLRVINQENGGLSAARNTGLEAAGGAYIWFVDSDDFIRKGCLRKLKGIAAETSCDRIPFHVYEFYDTLSPQEREKIENNTIRANTYPYNVTVWNNLFRLDSLKKAGLNFRYTQSRYSEDGVFMFEYSLTNPTEAAVDEVCYFYRRRPQSLTTSMSRESQHIKVQSYGIIVRVLEQYYCAGVGDRTYIANLWMSNLWTLMYSVVHLPISEALRELRKLKKENLFPKARPKECTLVKSYQTTRTDLVGKLFEKIYLNMHTYVGFFCMRLWKCVERVKHKMEGRQ